MNLRARITNETEIALIWTNETSQRRRMRKRERERAPNDDDEMSEIVRSSSEDGVEPKPIVAKRCTRPRGAQFNWKKLFNDTSRLATVWA